MEFWQLILKIGIVIAGIIVGIGMFSEVCWSVKLKVASTILAGVILIGFLAPLRTTVDTLGVVSVPGFGGAITLIGLAVLTGFIGYFISWPYGREIGILAVPSGLAVWAISYGSMADLMRTNPSLTQKLDLFAMLKWEPIFWLLVVAAGFVGVLIGHKVTHKRSSNESSNKSIVSTKNLYLNAIITILLSIFLVQLCIGIFAQDIRIPDATLGLVVVGQPAVGQIVFAVLVSFGIVAFVFKKFLDASYIWPIIASALVTLFIIIFKIEQDTLQSFIERYPPVFFPNAVITILPVQMVAFGTLGSIAGYWLAIYCSRQNTAK